MPNNHVPQCHIQTVYYLSRDSDSTTSLGILCHCFITLSRKKYFLISNLIYFPFPDECYPETVRAILLAGAVLGYFMLRHGTEIPSCQNAE